jgi:hypothetical protein
MKLSLSRKMLFSAVVSGLCACSGSSTTSSITGTVATGAAAQSLTATDETGAVTTISVASNGTFSAVLAPGHTYALTVNTAALALPLVFPRSSGQLDSTFTLASAGATVALGALHSVEAMPSTGLEVVSTAIVTAELTVDGGVIDDTGSTATCDQPMGGCVGMDGGHRHGPGEPPQLDDGGLPPLPPDFDGGVRVHGPPPDSDGGIPRQADPNQPFAYPEHNPPARVDCGSGQPDGHPHR